MAGFERHRDALTALGAAVACASADALDGAREVASEVAFPVGYGMNREDAATLGAWWQEQRRFMQPAEFVLGADGKVIASSYSDGPLGRILAEDVIGLLKALSKQSA